MLVKILGIIAAVIALFSVYLQLTYKQRFEAPPTGIVASSDSAVIARGKYIVTSLSHCNECHTSKSIRKTGLAVAELPLSGGDVIHTPFADFYAPNITPDEETGIGKFTDEQLARAIRYGINHEGLAMAPFMSYSELSDADLGAVISYLRTNKPVHNVVPPRDPNLLGKAILRFVMKPYDNPAVSTLKMADTTAVYGGYLTSSVGNCIGCHTNRSPVGEFVGAPFSGGYVMEEEAGRFTTPNLTPDTATGRITYWSAEMFVNRFRQGKLVPGTPMPWDYYKNMTDNDLKAIYNFLQSLPPTTNETWETFVPRENQSQSTAVAR